LYLNCSQNGETFLYSGEYDYVPSNIMLSLNKDNNLCISIWLADRCCMFEMYTQFYSVTAK